MPDVSSYSARSPLNQATISLDVIVAGKVAAAATVSTALGAVAVDPFTASVAVALMLTVPTSPAIGVTKRDQVSPDTVAAPNERDPNWTLPTVPGRVIVPVIRYVTPTVSVSPVIGTEMAHAIEIAAAAETRPAVAMVTSDAIPGPGNPEPDQSGALESHV